jgi:hypothetical protein
MGRSIVSKEVLMNAVVVAKSDTHYSNSRKFHDCDGTATLKIICAGAASNITVTQQCSLDNVTWYDPTNEAGAIGAVENAITVTAGRYLSFTPVLCDYIRFKVVQGDIGGTNTATVTLELSYRVEV